MEQYEQGLRRAYENENGLYHENDRLYVAGTRGLRDVSQWPLIPLNKTSQNDIYKRMDEYLNNNPGITTLIGHSAAGAAVLDKAKRDPKYITITYGSPILDTDFITKHNVVRRTNRYAHFFEPVAILDAGAARSFIPWNFNPHSPASAYRKGNGLFDNNSVS